jgi:hypothetical protein
MTGKSYYFTTLADWQRHAARFANSHFIVLSRDDPGAPPMECGGSPPPSAVRARPDVLLESAKSAEARPDDVKAVEAHGFTPAKNDGAKAPSDAQPHPQHVAEVPSGADQQTSTPPATRILVLIEADEGVHLSLDDDPAFEALPHPLAQKSISPAAQAVLAPHGVAPGATTFDAAEALARVHPLLRHRVF